MTKTLPLPDGAVLDTWDPGHHHSYTLPTAFVVCVGYDPEPVPHGRHPRQYRDHAVTCIDCATETLRADALCHPCATTRPRPPFAGTINVPLPPQQTGRETWVTAVALTVTAACWAAIAFADGWVKLAALVVAVPAVIAATPKACR